MTSLTFVLLSGALSFGVPMALAIRELLTLSPSRGGDDEPPPKEHFPRAPKPLPECLLPRPILVRDPSRLRMLEDA